MALPGLFWIELALGVVLLLLSAKAHGRQIRLERELEGYIEVDLMKENPPWVEALWRKDRLRFWATFPVAVLVLVVTGLLTLPSLFGTEPLGNPIVGTLLLAAFLWPLTVTFTSNGVQSAARLNRARRERSNDAKPGQARENAGPWLRSAIWGTALYWGAVVAFGALAILAAMS